MSQSGILVLVFFIFIGYIENMDPHIMKIHVHSSYYESPEGAWGFSKKP